MKNDELERTRNRINLIVKLVLFIVLAIILLLAIIYGKEKEKEPTLSVETIEQIIRDVYTPKSMKEFAESADRYSGTVMTYKVIQDFYYYDGDELSEEALKREVDVKVNHCSSKNNSSNEEYYKADVNLRYGDGTNEKFIVTFYVDEIGLIYSYEINTSE